MKNFRLVQEHFSKRRCGQCDSLFLPAGIQLVREEEDYWIVRVTCLSCNQLAGIALVGIEPAGNAPVAPPKNLPAIPAPEHIRSDLPPATPLTQRERRKFDKLGPITSDELIDLHNFLSGLGSDWMKHLPIAYN